MKVLIGWLAALVMLTGCAATPVAPSLTPSNPVPSAATPSWTASAAAPQLPSVRISSVVNFRDVAGRGKGLKLADGRRMATGVVYRSAKLKGMSKKDRTALRAAGVSDIIDLRTDAVAKRSPDPAIRGVRYQLINIFAKPSREWPALRTVKQATAERKRINRDFVTSAAQRKKIGQVLTRIAAAKGAVVIHCTEGKDRTGWIAAVLHLTVGVERKDVLAEYLLSNQRRREAIETSVAKVKRAKGAKQAAIARIRLEVAAPYLRAGLDELAERYGDIDGYLTDGLGLSRSTIGTLKDKLRR